MLPLGFVFWAEIVSLNEFQKLIEWFCWIISCLSSTLIHRSACFILQSGKSLTQILHRHIIQSQIKNVSLSLPSSLWQFFIVLLIILLAELILLILFFVYSDKVSLLILLSYVEHLS